MSEWIIEFIGNGRYLAIALLMLLENVFPPIPSELVLPFAGFVSARGELNPVGVLVAAVTGSLLGALPWYWAGRRLGHDRLRAFAQRRGRWLTLTPDDVDRAQYQGRAPSSEPATAAARTPRGLSSPRADTNPANGSTSSDGMGGNTFSSSISNAMAR
jgi:hypothetical protein